MIFELQLVANLEGGGRIGSAHDGFKEGDIGRQSTAEKLGHRGQRALQHFRIAAGHVFVREIIEPRRAEDAGANRPADNLRGSCVELRTGLCIQRMRAPFALNAGRRRRFGHFYLRPAKHFE